LKHMVDATGTVVDNAWHVSFPKAWDSA